MAYYENSDIIILVSDKQDWQCTHNCNNEAHLCNHCCHGKANVLHILSVSVALVTQHAMHIHCVIFTSVSSPAVTYFFTLSHKWHNSRKNLLNMKCVFDFFDNFSLRHVSVSEELKEILSPMHLRLHVQYLLFMSDFNGT
jgi:hypothetical protein